LLSTLYGMFCSFVHVSYDSVVPLGWVGLGRDFKFQLGWVGSASRWVGLDWVNKIDPWTTLVPQSRRWARKLVRDAWYNPHFVCTLV